MSPSMVVYALGFLVFVGLIAVLYVVGTRQERGRRQALSALTRRNGWTYTINANRLVADRYHGEPFLGPGEGRVEDLISGTHRGRPFLAFQYSYLRRAGQSRVRVAFTHVAVPLPHPAPPVQIRQQDLRTRLAEGFGGHRFILGYQPFDQRFDVHGRIDAFTRALFGADLAPWLMSLPHATPLTIDGAELRTWSDGRMQDRHLLFLVDYLDTALERIPATLWEASPG